MFTPKELALRALERTHAIFHHVIEQFPLDRWRDTPGGQANGLFGVLKHLIECEGWWLINIGVPEDQRPLLPDLGAFGSAKEMLDAFAAARAHLMGILRNLPDEWYENAVLTCHYGNLHSGAELMLYAAEHDHCHNGQIEMLEMALSKEA